MSGAFIFLIIPSRRRIHTVSLVDMLRFVRLVRLRWYLSGCEAQDINSRRLALALLDTLYKADAPAGVQFGQQLHGLIPPAV